MQRSQQVSRTQQGADEPSSSILLVNDSPALQDTTRALINGSRWHCLHSQDSVSALCDIVDHQPNAVLVDSDIGPLDAWQFCALIKQHRQYSNTRVVILERQDDVVSRARADAAGADACLRVPFSAEELLQELEKRQEQRA